MPRKKTIAELLGAVDEVLSVDELAHVSHLSIAISHAIDIAEATPTSLNGRARALVVTKLQEAEHWLLEIVREASAR